MKARDEYLKRKQGHTECFCCRVGEAAAVKSFWSNQAEAKLKRSSLVHISLREHT